MKRGKKEDGKTLPSSLHRLRAQRTMVPLLQKKERNEKGEDPVIKRARKERGSKRKVENKNKPSEHLSGGKIEKKRRTKEGLEGGFVCDPTSVALTPVGEEPNQRREIAAECLAHKIKCDIEQREKRKEENKVETDNRS